MGQVLQSASSKIVPFVPGCMCTILNNMNEDSTEPYDMI
jgi:hypothetical protein